MAQSILKQSDRAKRSPNATDQHVGKRVRIRRVMLDMSQTDVADGLGVAFQQVQKYENGTNRLSASRLQQISQILRVPVQFFFEGVPALKRQLGVSGGPSPTYVSDFLATSDGLALVKAFVQIKDPALRRSIVTMVKQIAGGGD
jgi:transcriptional regulator with XRE-family HTH domain